MGDIWHANNTRATQARILRTTSKQGSWKLLVPLFFDPCRISFEPGDFIVHDRFVYHVAIHGAFPPDLHYLRSDSTAECSEDMVLLVVLGARDLDLGSVALPTL
jgi:hypothetical protein